MRVLFYFFLLLFSQFPLCAQTGTEFWFVAPEVANDHNDRPISLRLSSYSNAANVTISQPANPGFSPIVINIPPNTTSKIDLTPYINNIENKPADIILKKGILITSSAIISGYYEVETSNNTDIFSLKAGNALGREFVIPFQSYWSNGTKYSPEAYHAINIVATEDSTNITITPTKDCYNHPANVPFTISLDRGETYSLMVSNPDSNQKLGGSTIISDKPIAVTISDDSAGNSNYGSCLDLIGDQMIPVENIGSEYVVVRGFLSQPDRVYICAVENNTNIYINGTNVATLMRGQQYEHVLSDPSVYITSSSNIYVMHVTGFGCEIGMSVLPSLSCTGSNELSFTRSQNKPFYLLVITPTGSEGDFSIDGNNGLLQVTDFDPVPGSLGKWMVARKLFTTGEISSGQNYRVKNPSAKFHMAIINGGEETGCMYGYFSDFAKVMTGNIFHM